MTNDFGRWLRGQLARREMSMTAFASKIGVSHSSVSLWLDGKRVPTPRSIEKIADVFAGVDQDMLLTLAGHRPRDLDRDPEAPGEQIAALARRVEWKGDRYETVRAMLHRWIELDREGESGGEV